MAEVFISYRSTERQKVRALAQDIEALGHQVWFDQELTGGHAWWNTILKQIRACRVFVFALSPQSLDSVPCQLEYRYAHALQKLILPVLLVDDVNINFLPPELSAIQFVDYRQQDRTGALKLARAFGHLPAPQPLPDPLPEPPSTPLSPLGEVKEQIDQGEPLVFEQQAALLLQLKQHLSQPDLRKDALELLRQLRQRSDVFARIAEEINTILKDRAASSAVSSRGQTPQPAPTPAVASSTSLPRPVAAYEQPVPLLKPRWGLIRASAIACAFGALFPAVSLVLHGAEGFNTRDFALFIVPWLAQGWVTARYIRRNWGTGRNRSFWWQLRSSLMAGPLNFVLVPRIIGKWLWLNVFIVGVGWLVSIAASGYLSITFLIDRAQALVWRLFGRISCPNPPCLEELVGVTAWFVSSALVLGALGVYFTGIAINHALRHREHAASGT